jgi:glycosyltransferase involved in cell wall biosynthesis
MEHPPRIAFVSLTDPRVPYQLSGMPHKMWKALSTLADVTPLFPGIGNGRFGPLSKIQNEGLLGKQLCRIRTKLFNFDGSLKFKDAKGDNAAYEAIWRTAHLESQSIGKRIRSGKYDAVLGVIMPWLMLDRATDLPTLYFTDTVTANTNEHYPAFQNRPPSYHRASCDIETQMYHSVDEAAFPANFIRNIAIEKHAANRTRTSVIPMGANILPDEPVSQIIPPPSREDLQLCMIASDPIRKRTDLAVEVVKRLRSAGIAATLTLVGPPTKRALESPHVICEGPLQLGKSEDLRKHKEILHSTHWLILPSLGEGAAIAPAEAAHFGVPSIVSNAGGLPDVVEDRISGIVLPVEDHAESYARHLMQTLNEHNIHTDYAIAALERAKKTFTWEAWAKGLMALIESERIDKKE